MYKTKCQYCGHELEQLQQFERVRREKNHWRQEAADVSSELARLSRKYERDVNQYEQAIAKMAGAVLNMNGVNITEKTWKRLASLCHPDKHDGSDTAKEITQWLNEIRPRNSSSPER